MIVVDTYQGMDSNRIPLCEYKELIMNHNVNLEYSEDAEVWFDYEMPDNLTIMSDEEFFNTMIDFEFV